MFKPPTAIRVLIGVYLVLLVAVPASAQTSPSNLLVSSGVTFLPSEDEAGELTADIAVPLKFEAPIAGFNAFVPRQGTEKHIFGAGLRTGGYGIGIGALVRFWFTQKLFLDAGISYFPGSYAGYTSFGQNTVMASVLYMFKQIDTNESIVFRIYAGGGINISTWNYDDGFTTYKDTLFGGQGLAGVEMIVKQLPQLGFGLDVGVYSGNNDVSGVGVTGIGGLGSMIYAVWYFK